MNVRLQLKRRAKRLLRSLGFDLSRYQASSHPLAKKERQLQDRGINLVLDVGANTGQYARSIRDLGYQGRIVSFEPLSEAFKLLQQNVQKDPAWKAHNFALGANDGNVEINIAENSWSSSLLGVNESHISAMPTAKCVGREMIRVKRLDDVFPGIYLQQSKVLLKIDTQGYEKLVLDGAIESLPRIDMVQLEMSFAPLYNGQPLFGELYDWLCEHDFQLACFESPWWDPQSGQLMQVDGVFQRVP